MDMHVPGGYAPRHTRGEHRLPVGSGVGGLDWPSDARCTGGLRNENGKRLTNCRSSKCPRHQPDTYAAHYAKHDGDILLVVNVMMFPVTS